jgi:hypothetical protein
MRPLPYAAVTSSCLTPCGKRLATGDGERALAVIPTAGARVSGQVRNRDHPGRGMVSFRAKRGIAIIPVEGPLFRDDCDSSPPALRASGRNDTTLSPIARRPSPVARRPSPVLVYRFFRRT